MSSSASVRVFSLPREALLTRLRQIIARLRAERPEVLDVRLFGSLARGDATAFSDVDLLILTQADAETDPIQRILRYLPYFDLDRGVDILVFTAAEWQARLDQGDPFAHTLMRESIRLIEPAQNC